MDAVASHPDPGPMRRSTRQSSSKVLTVEPRRPLKRTKRREEKQVKDVNGSKAEEMDSEDEESPSKKTRQDDGEEEGDKGDDLEMDVQESDDNVATKEDQETIHQKDSIHSARQPNSLRDHSQHVNLAPRLLLKRCPPIPTTLKQTESTKPDRVISSTKEAVAAIKSSTQHRAEHRRDVPTSVTSMAQYKEKMEAKAMTAGVPKMNPPNMYPVNMMRQRVNNIPAQKGSVQHRQQDEKGKERRKISPATKKKPENSPKGFMWCLWCLVLLVLLSCAASLVFKRAPGGAGRPSWSVDPGLFAAQFPLLQSRFPSQRPELWKRSKIHLERHLQTAQPTEPVSLILTAGRGAESTLRCLAKGLASSFSSALNASVLHIDGASKANQDSDQVKLDIDTQLRGAFEGDKPAAIIHRFEELPPGSTLIFYRYCDHENAAYKRAFFAFTVLLPQDEVREDLSLKVVEEMVQDYVKKRFVDSDNQTAFNKMDIDKYGGLWSRISHLILPVVSEAEMREC
ncbi:uncharacterized protein LOC143002875 [Genypterus blacodes]|uniref:uncharacterized protein LOC143002875 n=1 Tax=Genypterus blacodes TaxID=154954 RepID=UPI003F75CC15